MDAAVSTGGGTGAGDAGAAGLSPEHVGRRVVVRHRLDDGRATDVLGELLAVGDHLLLRRADGTTAQVPAADVVDARPVPPRASRARGRDPGVLGLEELLADAWWPPETARHGRWLLRAAQGRTRRANSVLALGAPLLPLGEAVDAVAGWYADRGLTARFAVPHPLPAGAGGAARQPDEAGLADVAALDAELARRGWAREQPTLVLSAATADVVSRSGPAAAGGVADVVVADAPDQAWLELAHPDAGDVLASLLTASPAQAFAAVLAADGRALSVGRAAGSRGWAVLTDLRTAPEHRRRGLGGAVVGALASWARDRGLRSTALQVVEDNGPALALYDRLGLSRHHGYTYRTAPDGR